MKRYSDALQCVPEVKNSSESFDALSREDLYTDHKMRKFNIYDEDDLQLQQVQ